MNNNNNKLGLVGILAATAIGAAGCNAIPQRVSLYDAQKHETSADYFQYKNVIETKLDAAEADRERRCFEKLRGIPYQSQNLAYDALSKCTLAERESDKMTYGIASVLIDGLKIYFLIDGLTGGKVSGRNQPQDPAGTISQGSSTAVGSPVIRGTITPSVGTTVIGNVVIPVAPVPVPWSP